LTAHTNYEFQDFQRVENVDTRFTVYVTEGKERPVGVIPIGITDNAGDFITATARITFGAIGVGAVTVTARVVAYMKLTGPITRLGCTPVSGTRAITRSSSTPVLTASPSAKRVAAYVFIAVAVAERVIAYV
jgi:hypothetical protein